MKPELEYFNVTQIKNPELLQDFLLYFFVCVCVCVCVFKL